MRATKAETLRLIEEADHDGLCRLERERGGVFRFLRSLAYDPEETIFWAAVDAVGPLSRCVAETDPEKVRSFVRRLLWSLSDESGDMAWSAPEMLTEIFLFNPVFCGDIGPIVLHLDELIFRKNAVRCAARIGERHPKLVAEVREELIAETKNPDPEIRAYAARALGWLGLEYRALLESLKDDPAEPVKRYRSRRLERVRVCDLVRETLERLGEPFGTGDALRDEMTKTTDKSEGRNP